MNQPTRWNAAGTGDLRRVSSVIFELLRRLGSATCVPTVNRNTTLPGRAVTIAFSIAMALACVCGKPGSGS